MAMDAQRQQELADRIRELRGRTPQRVIADRVGVTERAYQEWERGGGISWENLTELAKALGVTEEYLVYGEDGDTHRAATRLERIETEQRRLGVKLDALLDHFGIEDASADEVVSLSEMPPGERAAAIARREAARTRAQRPGARKAPGVGGPDSSDR